MFEKEQGCPALVNTSCGEPIVCTPEDAYRCFRFTHMDVLVLENHVFLKEKQPEMPGAKEYLAKFPLEWLMGFVNIDWRPDDRGYRKFAVTLVVGFALIGAALRAFGGSLAATRHTGRMGWGPLPWCLLIPLGILGPTPVRPAAARPFYAAWMAIAFVMGTIFGTLPMSAIYWILFGAIAGAMRLFGGDRLYRRRPTASLWHSHPGTPAADRYLSQF